MAICHPPVMISLSALVLCIPNASLRGFRDIQFVGVTRFNQSKCPFHLFTLCSLLGIRTMIVDYGETLHGPARGFLNKLVAGGIPGIETIIMLGAGDTPEPKRYKDLQVLPVVDGQVGMLPAGAEAA